MPQRDFIYTKPPYFPRFLGKTGYEETPLGLRSDRSWGTGIRPLRVIQSSIGEVDESPLIIGQTRMVRMTNNRPYDIAMEDIEINALPPPRELLSNSALFPETLFDGTVPNGNPVVAPPVVAPVSAPNNHNLNLHLNLHLNHNLNLHLNHNLNLHLNHRYPLILCLTLLHLS